MRTRNLYSPMGENLSVQESNGWEPVLNLIRRAKDICRDGGLMNTCACCRDRACRRTLVDWPMVRAISVTTKKPTLKLK